MHKRSSHSPGFRYELGGCARKDLKRLITSNKQVEDLGVVVDALNMCK